MTARFNMLRLLVALALGANTAEAFVIAPQHRLATGCRTRGQSSSQGQIYVHCTFVSWVGCCFAGVDICLCSLSPMFVAVLCSALLQTASSSQQRSNSNM